jgi:Trypsin
VRLGEHTISTEKDCETIETEKICVEEPPQNIGIENFVIHEEYVPNDQPRRDHRGGQNDIGLIKLKKEATYHYFVYPVCLPTAENHDKALKNKIETKVVAGWGMTEKGDEYPLS